MSRTHHHEKTHKKDYSKVVEEKKKHYLEEDFKEGLNNYVNHRYCECEECEPFSLIDYFREEKDREIYGG